MYFRFVELSMSLESELQEIDGIGPATAEKIVAVVEEHNTGSDIDVDLLDKFLRQHRIEEARALIKT